MIVNRLKQIAMITLIGLFSPVARAYPLESIQLLPEDVISVYDGDTMTIQIPLLPDVFGANLSVRILGIDTPEIRSTCELNTQRIKETEFAKQVRDYLIAKIAQSQRVVLTDLGRDKYFRLLATVTIDGVALSDELIAKGMAVPYDGGTKDSWCSIP